ncbi:ATP-dependent DNA helicase PcrA [bacterium endosymbiont of Escarpia laminata]|nr:MAG: ATP-dependent DNA helicase PcrA [bacterium endosymbiont of Escarpia laminata]
MTINQLLSDLNENQRKAACMPRQHALILAGAGTGKTKTIVSRAAYLISNGTPAHRIQILAFTRRSASEIVERVRMHLGEEAQGLKASTFHTWCISLIRKAPKVFGCKGYSVIDRDDQLQLYKVLRGKAQKSELPSAQEICDLYSFARNTVQSLNATLQKKSPECLHNIKKISEVMLAYEKRKKERHYLDYDDILDVVAQQMTVSEKTRIWVSSQYDHLLVDEMQDTNPLQWKLINPLKENVTLFCVGDDAQSIYGFRGADFQNVHSFASRVDNSITLKLQDNYRSTQEILNASNWLLSQSALSYGKNLTAMRGSGKKPELHTFINEWEEGRWIAEEIFNNKQMGEDWKNNMVLVRSGYAGRVIEGALLAKDIPYQFIGGTKLLESAHIRDLLSVLRIVGNQQDEIAWMRFLTLWNGVGEVTANKLIERILFLDGYDQVIKLLKDSDKLPLSAADAVGAVIKNQNNVSDALLDSFQVLEEILAEKYKKQEWDKRRRDIQLVRKLAEKHTSILGFIEEYLLDPVHVTQIDRKENDDVVTVITIHSAKGTECERCYVINVSPGSYPSSFSIGKEDEIEEERRVLYVALTRAKDELFVTRRGYSLWAEDKSKVDDNAESENYFLNALPEGLFNEIIHRHKLWNVDNDAPDVTEHVDVGINIGNIPPDPQEEEAEESNASDWNHMVDNREAFWLSELRCADGYLHRSNSQSKSHKDSAGIAEELDGDKMVKKKLQIERNKQMENHSGIKIESCSAYYDTKKNVCVFGELIAENKSPVNEYKEVQLVVYDSDGELMAREYTNWTEFGLMQSFDFNVDLSDFEMEPSRIKVYPTNG